MTAVPANDCMTFSIEEAAQRLGVSRAMAYNAAEKGQIPVVRVGRRLLVPKAKLLAMIGAEPKKEAA